MERATAIFLTEIPQEDWANTPESVKRLVGSLVEQIRSAEGTQQGLQEQVKRIHRIHRNPLLKMRPKDSRRTRKRKVAKRGVDKQDMKAIRNHCIRQSNAKGSKSIIPRSVVSVDMS